MNPGALREELFALAGALSAGTLDEPGRVRLAELLRASAKARQIWFQFHDLELGLAEYAAEPAASASTAPRRPWWRAPVAGYGLAASLAALLTWAGVSLLPPESPAPAVATLPKPGHVLTLAAQDDCEWLGGVRLVTGQRLSPGPLHLARGKALLHFDGGARLALAGPAQLVIESAGAARVLAGRVAVHAPEEAIGFRILTAEGTAVDLGTEFVVEVRPEGGASCHVVEGAVEWHSGQPGRGVALLREGDARRFVAGRIDAIEAPGSRFADFLPAPAAPAGRLLAYEPFDYRDADAPAESLAGGTGWRSPWRGRFVASDTVDVDPRIRIDPAASLAMPAGLAPSAGGSLAFGGPRTYRLRALPEPVDFGRDQLLYLSFLLRPSSPPPPEAAPLSPLRLEFRSSTDYWTNVIGISFTAEKQPFILANGNNSLGGPALAAGATYFVVCKIAASQAGSDQVFMKLYGPGQRVDAQETASWTVASRDLNFDCALDHLVLAVPSKIDNGRLDELRIGTAWGAVVPQQANAARP
jgi:hypothetical protein